MKTWCLGVFLLIQAILDGRKGYVDLRILFVQSIVGLWMSDLSAAGINEWLIRILPGMALLWISFLSAGKIGAGDGWLFVSLCVYLTAAQQIVLFSGAVILSAVWTAALICLRRVDKECEVPFVPFVLLAYVGGVYSGWF